MAETDLQQLHVAVIAFPYGSHGSTILNITRGLAVVAPNVTFSIFNTEKSNASLFGSSSCSCPGYDNIHLYIVDEGIPESHVFFGNHIEKIDLFLKATPDNFRKAINKAVKGTKKKITCVIIDAFLTVTGSIIAKELGGVPWIPVWFSGASAISCHFHTDLIREMLNGKGDDEILDFVPGMKSFRSCDLPDVGSKDLESLFARTLHMVGAEMPRATAVIINSFEYLEWDVFEDLKSKLKMCLAIGPLSVVCPPSSSSASLDDQYGCILWLDCQKPASVAYIGFGTSASPPSDELFALAEGLEASGVPFLWSLKDSVKAELPGGFLESTGGRGKLVPWTPQTKILEHSAVGVFVTHCGWNSVLDSIVGGVPIICRPFFGEQSLNARFVSNVGEIGVSMGGKVFTKEGIMKALDLVLCKEQGEKMREKATILREKAKQSVSPTGSSFNNFKTLLEIITGT